MKFIKETLSYLDLHVIKLTYDSSRPYVLFVHGGPGYHCGIVEYLIESNQLFATLHYNLILYDQRACGRSADLRKYSDVVHSDNVDDLDKLIFHIQDFWHLKLLGIMGHSYGAKVVVDLYQKSLLSLPAIFVATANSMLTPRLNNLLLDLAYLRKIDPEKYTLILDQMDDMTVETLWTLTEQLAPLFLENKDRPHYYWADRECFEKVTAIQSEIKIAINHEVFMSVRRDLYSNKDNHAVAIDSLSTPTLWINGFHDKIMNGADGLIYPDHKVKILFKSAHYPHLEENEKFCVLVNNFLEKWQVSIQHI